MTKGLPLLAALLAGCATADREPAGADADRVADLTVLRLGQPYLGGALEVTRLRQGGGALVVGVTNRTGAPLRVRWRFRYTDRDGWERRTRDSAAWKTVEIAAGKEWGWEGAPEVAEAATVGMDWRLEKD